MAQSEDPEDHFAPATHRVRAGTLLIANTDLMEPTFRRSVIYVVEHNDGGTLGVVLNRPSETAVFNAGLTANGEPFALTSTTAGDCCTSSVTPTPTGAGWERRRQ